MKIPLFYIYNIFKYFFNIITFSVLHIVDNYLSLNDFNIESLTTEKDKVEAEIEHRVSKFMMEEVCLLLPEEERKLRLCLLSLSK